MIRLIMAASIYIHDFLRRWMPTNVIRDQVRNRQGLKWGIPAMLLAVPYLGVAYWLTTLIDTGAPKWLYLIVLVCIWSGIKMLWLGPISLVLLLRVRAQEAIARRQKKAEQGGAVNDGSTA
ncbi:sulfate permease [Actinomycetaceae bacterium MB13-C1-2]|nr:sulfate permease [Actinomycetaceae bacterium MB13-C1-2]